MPQVQLWIKRCVDIAISVVALLISLPVIVLVAISIKADSRGPILFRQTRLGKGERLFKLNKFRTMVLNAARIGAGLSTGQRDPRITRVGSFLRKTSLDELPQLFNVLLGDLSLVGPRPTVPQHLEYYGPFEKRRLEMKPGITGLAMVRGRSSNPWSVRIKHDVEYVDSFSLWLDLRILLKTVVVVLRREGIYYDYEKHGSAFDLKKPQDGKDCAQADGVTNE